MSPERVVNGNGAGTMGNMSGEPTFQFPEEVVPASVEEIYNTPMERLKLMVREMMDRVPGTVYISANRSPNSYEKEAIPDKPGKFRLKPKPIGAGGLMTLFKEFGAHADKLAWVGYVGDTSNVDEEAIEHLARGNPSGNGLESVPLVPVGMPEKVFQNYYGNFANNLWFPLHGGLLVNYADFDQMRAAWPDYQAGNMAFAQAYFHNLTENDLLLDNDYHHLLGAKYLRQLNAQAGKKDPKMMMYMHTPMMNLDEFNQLKQGLGETASLELLEALLYYDIVGFSSVSNRNKYIACLQKNLNGVEIGVEDADGGITITYKGRKTLLKKYAVGLDPDAWEQKGQKKEVVEKSNQLGDFFRHWKTDDPEEEEMLRSDPERLEAFLKRKEGRVAVDDNVMHIGRVDRLEPSKGFMHGAKAFSRLLKKYPELIGAVQYLMVGATDSRMDKAVYQHLQKRMEQWTRAMNNRARKLSGNEELSVAILRLQGLRDDELFAFYKGLDLLDISALADGTNLVIQEGALVGAKAVAIGANTGAAENIQAMENYDPYDYQGHAAVMHKLLTMPPEKRAAYMKEVVRQIRKHNVHQYAYRLIRDGAGLFEQQAA